MGNVTRCFSLLLALLLITAPMIGCSKQSNLNSYVLPGSELGGDEDKGIPPLSKIMVWPMSNIAAGGASKGVEVPLTDFLVDTLYLNDSFEGVSILDDGQAKNLLARAGEELGLKKKPKEPHQSALVSTKLGLLTGTEAVLMTRIDEYDEIKVDKVTYTSVAISFFLYDAREQSYPTLDSFTQSRSLWRMNAIRTAKETPLQGRASLGPTARKLVIQAVDRLEKDMMQGMAVARRMKAQKIGELSGQAAEQLRAGEYDAAIATWQNVLDVDPGNADAVAAIAAIEEEKVASEERAKEMERQEQMAGHIQMAGELEGAGDLAGARAEWEKLAALEDGNADAADNISRLDAALSAAAAVDMEKEISANLHLAQKALGETKYTEAITAAKKVLAADSGNDKAKEILAAAEQKLEEARASEGDVTTAPATAEPAPAAAPEAAPEAASTPSEVAPEAAAADISGIEKIRNEAMEYFNSEQYAEAEESWKKLLEMAPDDKQGLEMLETTQMLIEALK